jgi:hypothetical protein
LGNIANTGLKLEIRWGTGKNWLNWSSRSWQNVGKHWGLCKYGGNPGIWQKLALGDPARGDLGMPGEVGRLAGAGGSFTSAFCFQTSAQIRTLFLTKTTSAQFRTPTRPAQIPHSYFYTELHTDSTFVFIYQCV